MAYNFYSILNYVATVFPALLIVTTVNGFSSALIAKLMGDKTAQEEGFLTLNPLAHVDVFGLTVVLLLIASIYLIFGDGVSTSMIMAVLMVSSIQWRYPVPVNEDFFRNRTLGVILSVFSGLIGLSALILIVFYMIKYLPFGSMPRALFIPLINILVEIVDYSAWFVAWDVIPIPPFDASKLLPLIVPNKYHYIIDWLEENAFFILIFLFLMPFASDIFFGILVSISQLLKHALSYLVF